MRDPLILNVLSYIIRNYFVSSISIKSRVPKPECERFMFKVKAPII